MVGRDGAVGVGQIPLLDGRDDVEQDQALDGIGRVERQAIGDTAAAIVTHDVEPVMAERAHHADAVLRHRALGIGDVAGIARWRR